MQIRPAIRTDIEMFRDIDGVVESTSYLHLDRAGDRLAFSIKIEPRPLREKLIQANRLEEDALFTYRQVTDAQSRPETNTLHVVDLRVDYDFRRQGLATAMLYQIIQNARERGSRAVYAEAVANNHPAQELLLKCGFEMSGVDWRRQSNHDLIKERATLLWYVPLD